MVDLHHLGKKHLHAGPCRLSTPVLEQLAREKAKIMELGLSINDVNSILNTTPNNQEEEDEDLESPRR